MDALTITLPFPAAGEGTRARTRVDHKTSEEAALVRRVQARDEMAFREVVERYQSKVFSIIFGILRNLNDAEDIAQQVFAKVYFSIKNFDFRSSLLTWIYKITVNECYDYLRKKRVRKLVEKGLARDHRFNRREVAEAIELAAEQMDITVGDYLLDSVPADRKREKPAPSPGEAVARR